jgi:hypothetical protein
MSMGQHLAPRINRIGAALGALLGRLLVVGLVAMALLVIASALGAPAAQFLVRSTEAFITLEKQIGRGGLLPGHYIRF